MSNVINCTFYCQDILPKAQIITTIDSYCSEHQIFSHFQDVFEDDENSIVCYLSDDFDMQYSDHFMEPIIYTMEGIPFYEKIINDLDILQGLIKKVFEFNVVSKIELRLSFVEVDEFEYRVYETGINQMKHIIMSEYLTSSQVPVIKLVIHNK